jgi:hypothetical protein
MDLTTLLTSLGGKPARSTWRSRTLPESSDFAQELSSSSNDQYLLMQQLLDQTKDALISKALIANKIMD